MTVEEFAKLVRSGDANLRVDKITLFAEGQRVRGYGQLKIDTEEMVLEFQARKAVVPVPKRHVWKAADSWSLKGTIEENLKFSSSCASPGGRRQSWVLGRSTNVQLLRVPNLEAAPAGFDALSRSQKDRLLKRTTKVPKHPKVSFFAVLVGAKPAFLNAGTKTIVVNDFLPRGGPGSSHDTFIDRGRDYDFALIKRDDDLHVHFESKASFRSKGQDDDWRCFRALLAAIGFTHGFQPWPFWIQYWRDGKLMTNRFTTACKLTKTPHAPFDTVIETKFIGRKGTRNSAIRLAAKFFQKKTKLSEGLAHLLFLFRESGNSSTHFDVRTLAICSLFEGVVMLMFEELKLECNVLANDPEFAHYLTVRDRLSKRLRKIGAASGRAAYHRLAGLISHAQAIRVKDRFEALCRFFGLDFKNIMKSRLDAWSAERNLLAHGSWGGKGVSFDNQALIAGGINILVPKAYRILGANEGLSFCWRD